MLPLAVLVIYVFVESKSGDNLAVTKQLDNSSQDLAGSLESALYRGIRKETPTNTNNKETTETLFPNTQPIHIKDVPVKASVADSWPERIAGLSNTPSLPEDTVKFFVFDSDGYHSIWMKDMNYSIDIIWVDKDGVIVDLVTEVSPDSYPDTFVPDTPARYVVETVSGFSKANQIAVGDKVEIPQL